MEKVMLVQRMSRRWSQRFIDFYINPEMFAQLLETLPAKKCKADRISNINASVSKKLLQWGIERGFVTVSGGYLRVCNQELGVVGATYKRTLLGDTYLEKYYELRSLLTNQVSEHEHAEVAEHQDQY